MTVVAETAVVKVASVLVLIVETPAAKSDRDEEQTEDCQPSDRTMNTLSMLLV